MSKVNEWAAPRPPEGAPSAGQEAGPVASRPPTWSSYRLGDDGQSGVGVTVHELDSGVAGPNLLVLGGVHGDEVGGIVAAGRISRRNWELLRGRLTVVPIAHEAAFFANLRQSPLDGGDLARSFPGRADGTATQMLAEIITRELIHKASLLIDLHTGNAGTDMPLLVGCLDDGSPSAELATKFAAGFGMSLVWTHPSLGPGRSLGVAQELGIPALYTESPVGGVLEERYLQAYVDGVASTLEGLEMVVGTARERPVPDLWLHGNGDFDSMAATDVGGLFLRRVQLMDFVEAGQICGEVLSPRGAITAEISAPAGGFVTTLQRAAVVAAGDPVVGITAEHPRRGGRA